MPVVEYKIYKRVTDVQTRTQSDSTDGPRDFGATQEVFFDPDPANFPNYEGLYSDFPDIDRHGCQMAKFDLFLSLECARVEGVGAHSKEGKGSNFAA